ncbi:MAG: polymer-forming cytoskeletal protein [Gammaproteobacteria bacterium]|nr:polymer-forming cytoskeletal protein [Gammaproteobacteria bacterium]NND59448.1 polymer-forming cytoskeletal protein [Gammaproteobacteria bacterium]
MLGRNSTPSTPKRKSANIDTLVGSKTRVSGDIEFTGGFHVDGYIKGNISAEPDSDSVLSISEHGTVEGSVAVPHVILNGTVKGDVKARERVELGSTARVIGNVFYNLIEMAIGAEINGKLIHQPKGAPTLVEHLPSDDVVHVGNKPKAASK